MLNDDNYYQTSAWMRTRLGLKGNELMTYAIIHGFTQKEGFWFTGSLSYLADWLGTTIPTACLVLKGLTEKGLLIKESWRENGVLCTRYKINRDKLDFLTPPPEDFNSVVSTEPAPVADEPAPVKKTVAKKTAPKKALEPAEKSDIFEEYAKDDAELLDKLNDFAQFRKDIKAPLTELAKKQLVKKLEKECVDRSERIEALGESMLNNWKSVFPESLPSRKHSVKSNNYNPKNAPKTYDYSLDGLIPGVDYLG